LNFAVKGTPSINDLQSIGIIPVPYTWMSQIQTSQNAPTQTSERLLPHQFYILTKAFIWLLLLKTTLRPIITFLFYHNHIEKGWTAYTVKNFGLLEKVLPFVFGKKLQNHIRLTTGKTAGQLSRTRKK